MKNKTRDEIVRECANMVIACWQHYADAPIEGDELVVPKIVLALQDILPEKVATGDWFQAALEREKCLAEKESICDSHESCDCCPHFADCADGQPPREVK